MQANDDTKLILFKLLCYQSDRIDRLVVYFGTVLYYDIKVSVQCLSTSL